jgi:hypothetical protein
VSVYRCFYEMIKILLSLKLLNFQYNVSFDYCNFACGIMYCILFFIVVYCILYVCDVYTIYLQLSTIVLLTYIYVFIKI